MKEKSTPEAVSYSPFYGLVLVFALLIAAEFLNLRQNLERRDLLESSSTQINATVTNANTINVIVESLGRDLLQLSSTSAEAKKIIAEFDIRLNASASTPSPAPVVPVEKK